MKYKKLYEQELEVTGQLRNENADLLKAFVLACRILNDVVGCPAADWDECMQCDAGSYDPESDIDPDERHDWVCWQRHVKERVAGEQVCRVCGCTQNNACPGGCYWVEDDLCSACSQG